MASDAFLGIDLGTSGCRAIVIDDDGVVVAEARKTLPASRRPTGGASTQSPVEWWQAVQSLVRTVTTGVEHRIRALSIDGTSSTTLLCDHQGEPLTPALMYDDRQAAAQAQTIATAVPTDSPVQGPGSALAKAMWLSASIPHDKIAYILHQADWLAACFTRRFGICDENNALKLGYDVIARRWPDWIDRLPIERRWFPQVVPVGTVIAPIDGDVAAMLSLAGDVVVVAGTTDSNAATLAAGADDIGDAVTSLGSTLVLKVLSDKPVYSAADGVYSHRLGEQWLVGGASNSGGGVLRQYFNDEQLDALSRRIDPDRPSGLDYYPLPGIGERFPHADPAKQPQLSPRPNDDALFLQGLLEGIAAIEAAGYRRLHALGAPYPKQVQTSGGGAANLVWQKIRARYLGVPVRSATQTEAAYGAALIARCGIRAARSAS